MKVLNLYTGGGVTLSPVNADGRLLSEYVRLVADDGLAITDGDIVVSCIDVRLKEACKWRDCEGIDESQDFNTDQALEKILAGQ